jgi:hypothetical protein
MNKEKEMMVLAISVSSTNNVSHKQQIITGEIGLKAFESIMI